MHKFDGSKKQIEKSKNTIYETKQSSVHDIKYTDPSFLTTLFKEIDRQTKIKKNPMLFILDRNLVEYKKVEEGAPRKVKEITHIDDLPLEASYGTIYLIKGSTIFGITTQEEEEFIVDPVKDWRALFNDKVKAIKTNVVSHNIFIGDINEFSNPNQFIDMDGMTSYDLNKTHSFIMALVKNKFKVYVVDREKIKL